MSKGKLGPGETIIGRGKTVERHYPGAPTPPLTGPQRAEAFCREILKAPRVPQWIREGAHSVLGEDGNEGQDWVQEENRSNESYRFARDQVGRR